MEVDLVSVNGACHTGEEHSGQFWQTSERVGCKASLQLEVEEDYSPLSSPDCIPAGPSVPQGVLVKLQCEEEETFETYYQKRNSATPGVFVTSSTNFDLQCEDEGLECSSACSEELQGGVNEDDESIILIDSLEEEEDLEHISGSPLTYKGKKYDASFQDVSELQEHQQICLTENSYQCPVCGKEFYHAVNLLMHMLIHSSDRPYKCPECDKGFFHTADIWRHLHNVHKIECSKTSGNGMARNLWSPGHRNGGGNVYQHCSGDQVPGEEECKSYICPTCGKGFHKPNLLSKHKVVHRQDKPYECHECGKSFVQLLRLKRHQQTHSGERPFYCEE